MTASSDEIRLLKKSDDRSVFSCGDIELDRYFQRFAGQNQFRHYIGTTYVSVIDQQITGFISISSGELAADTIHAVTKKSLPRYPLPILRLSRLAVDQRYQGRGIGKQLLRATLLMALEMRNHYGCVGIIVDAKLQALEFYKSFGFIELELVSGGLGDRPPPVSMFLPVSVVEQLI